MNKKFIIFGASSYIAQKVINNLSKKNEIIAFTRKKINSDNKNIKYIQTNYAENSILKKLKKILLESDQLTFIFFNAISDKSALLKIKKSEILNILKINLIIPILLTKMIIKNFLYSKINFIYMSSSRGHSGDKGISIYSTTKQGLAAFAKNMSIEYGSFGFNFRVILLGLLNGGLKNKIDNEKIIKKIISRSSIERYIKIQEILKAIKYIQNDSSGNGSVIKCDNGYN